MFFFIIVLGLLASASTFKLEIHAQSYCVSSTLNYCFGLTQPCNGVLVSITQPRNLTLFSCVKLSEVEEADVGVRHVFTLLDPFGRFICSHRTVNESLPQIGWGARYVVLTVLSRGFGVTPLDVPSICRGGALIRTRSSYHVVSACIHFPGWQWDDTFRYYSLQPTSNCSLFVRPLNNVPQSYYPKQLGTFAQPLRDEL
nr:NS7a protein [Rousettus bat coronavirus]